MVLFIPDTWFWFVTAFGVLLTASIIMSIQSRYFYTMDVVVRKFSMMDLELASTPQELTNIINGIYLLPTNGKSTPRPEKVARSLREQIVIDFILFMPAAYGSIFLLCMKVASVYEDGHIGQIAFSIFAWLQVVAFILDAIENIYLLQKIKPQTKPSSKSTHKAYQLLEVFKWGIALVAAVCVFSQLLYFWVSGLYSEDTLPYVLIMTIEIGAFIVLGVFISKLAKKMAKQS
jgi:hypothetical protein